MSSTYKCKFDEFEEKKHCDDDSGIVVVDFYLSKCPPCKKLAPAIEDLAKTYKNDGVKFVGLNLSSDDGHKFGKKWEISSAPKFAILKNGKLIKVIRDDHEKKIDRKLKKLLHGDDSDDSDHSRSHRDGSRGDECKSSRKSKTSKSSKHSKKK